MLFQIGGTQFTEADALTIALACVAVIVSFYALAKGCETFINNRRRKHERMEDDDGSTKHNVHFKEGEGEGLAIKKDSTLFRKILAGDVPASSPAEIKKLQQEVTTSRTFSIVDNGTLSEEAVAGNRGYAVVSGLNQRHPSLWNYVQQGLVDRDTIFLVGRNQAGLLAVEPFAGPRLQAMMTEEMAGQASYGIADQGFNFNKFSVDDVLSKNAPKKERMCAKGEVINPDGTVACAEGFKNKIERVANNVRRKIKEHASNAGASVDLGYNRPADYGERVCSLAAEAVNPHHLLSSASHPKGFATEAMSPAKNLSNPTTGFRDNLGILRRMERMGGLAYGRADTAPEKRAGGLKFSDLPEHYRTYFRTGFFEPANVSEAIDLQVPAEVDVHGAPVSRPDRITQLDPFAEYPVGTGPNAYQAVVKGFLEMGLDKGYVDHFICEHGAAWADMEVSGCPNTCGVEGMAGATDAWGDKLEGLCPDGTSGCGESMVDAWGDKIEGATDAWGDNVDGMANPWGKLNEQFRPVQQVFNQAGQFHVDHDLARAAKVTTGKGRR